MMKLYKYRNLKNLLNFNLNVHYFVKFYYLVPKASLHSVQLAFTVYGDDSQAASTPLIIQHALFGSKLNWHKICVGLKDKLQPKRKIYAVDARNHGDSPHVPEHTYPQAANDLKAFLQQHNISKASFVGHSMGGRIVMYLCLKYPNLVDRAIIVDISPINKIKDLSEYKQILGALRSVQLPSNNVTLGNARSIVKDQLQKKLDNEFVINFMLSNLKKTESGSFTWAINIDALYNQLEHIAALPEDILKNQFENPVLFIAGKHSNFMNQNELPAIQKIFTNSKLIWMDAGHTIQYEKPVETINEIANFLNN